MSKLPSSFIPSQQTIKVSKKVPFTGISQKIDTGNVQTSTQQSFKNNIYTKTPNVNKVTPVTTNPNTPIIDRPVTTTVYKQTTPILERPVTPTSSKLITPTVNGRSTPLPVSSPVTNKMTPTVSGRSTPISVSSPVMNKMTPTADLSSTHPSNNDIDELIISRHLKKNNPITQLKMDEKTADNNVNDVLVKLISVDEYRKLKNIKGEIISEATISTPKILQCCQNNGYSICSHISDRKINNEISNYFTLIRLNDNSIRGVFGQY